jgi:hypothetical protein
MSDQVVATIRTVVPMIVGTVVGWAANAGVVIPEVTSDALTVAITGIASAVYYMAARAAEQRWPAAGRLLGHPGAPTYTR